MEKFEAVEALTTYQIAVEAAADQLTEGVWTARELGAPWSEIGATLNISKQAAQQKFGNRPAPEAPARPTEDDFGTMPILPNMVADEDNPNGYTYENSKTTAKVLTKAVMNGLDVKKEEVTPLFNGSAEQITVLIQAPKGTGYLYLVQTRGTIRQTVSHGAYEAFERGSKMNKISIRHLLGRINEWGNPDTIYS